MGATKSIVSPLCNGDPLYDNYIYMDYFSYRDDDKSNIWREERRYNMLVTLSEDVDLSLLVGAKRIPLANYQ